MKINTKVLSNAIFRLCFLSLPFSRLFFTHHVHSSTRFVQPSPYSWRYLCTHLEDVLLHSLCPNSPVLSSNAFHSSMLPTDLPNPPIKVIQFVYCVRKEKYYCYFRLKFVLTLNVSPGNCLFRHLHSRRTENFLCI